MMKMAAALVCDCVSLGKPDSRSKPRSENACGGSARSLTERTHFRLGLQISAVRERVNIERNGMPLRPRVLRAGAPSNIGSRYGF